MYDVLHISSSWVELGYLEQTWCCLLFEKFEVVLNNCKGKDQDEQKYEIDEL